MPRSHRDAYAKAIDKVREQHGLSPAPTKAMIECPKCGTKQVVSDIPGRQNCIRCGFDLSQLKQKSEIKTA